MAKKERHRRKGKEPEAEAEAEEELLEEIAEEEEPKKGGRGKKKDRTRDSSVIYKTGEMPRLRGGGVAKKLAFYISATIALIMVIVLIVMFIVMMGALDKQIDADGVAAAKLLAAMDLESWKKTYGMDNLDLSEEDKPALMKFNQERLANVLKGPSSQILNATIYKNAYEGPMIRRDARDPYMKGDPPQFNGSDSFNVGDVTVERGFIEINKRIYSGRSYTAPIKDFKDETIGFSRVVLSEDLIDRRKWGLLGTFFILFVVFIGLGIGAAFLVGRKITEPVQHLIEDMTIVAGGDLTHHTMPKSQDEIGLLARTFDKMTKNLQEAQTKEVEIAAQKHQMAIAQEVQSNLLPTKIPEVPGYEIVAYHRSSKEVDGNYYDVIQYPDGKLGILVAAASGKGIPAAMVITMARSFFRALETQAHNAAEMMKQANRLISPDLRAGMYVEVLMILLDPKAHKAKLVSAGPTSLFRYGFGDKKLQGIHAEGIALGFDKGPVFDKSLKEVEFDIGPGDRLVLNTPSIFTIGNPEGAELGTIGFAKAINKHATKNSDAFVNLVVNILDNYAGKDIDDTDITFVTVRRTVA